MTRSVVGTIEFGEGRRSLSLAVAQGIGPLPGSRHRRHVSMPPPGQSTPHRLWRFRATWRHSKISLSATLKLSPTEAPAKSYLSSLLQLGLSCQGVNSSYLACFYQTAWITSMYHGSPFCRVCGYRSETAPWGIDGRTPLYNYCPCCGVEHGYQDSSPAGARSFRRQWIVSGATWVTESARPGEWSLEKQLENVPIEFR